MLIWGGMGHFEILLLIKVHHTQNKTTIKYIFCKIEEGQLEVDFELMTCRSVAYIMHLLCYASLIDIKFERKNLEVYICWFLFDLTPIPVLKKKIVNNPVVTSLVAKCFQSIPPP